MDPIIDCYVALAHARGKTRERQNPSNSPSTKRTGAKLTFTPEEVEKTQPQQFHDLEARALTILAHHQPKYTSRQFSIIPAKESSVNSLVFPNYGVQTGELYLRDGVFDLEYELQQFPHLEAAPPDEILAHRAKRYFDDLICSSVEINLALEDALSEEEKLSLQEMRYSAAGVNNAKEWYFQRFADVLGADVAKTMTSHVDALVRSETYGVYDSDRLHRHVFVDDAGTLTHFDFNGGYAHMHPALAMYRLLDAHIPRDDFLRLERNVIFPTEHQKAQAAVNYVHRAALHNSSLQQALEEKDTSLMSGVSEGRLLHNLRDFSHLFKELQEETCSSQRLFLHGRAKKHLELAASIVGENGPTYLKDAMLDRHILPFTTYVADHGSEFTYDSL